MTVVETRMSTWPAAKAAMVSCLSLGFCRPWTMATRRSGKTWVWSQRPYCWAAFIPSGSSWSTAGQTTYTCRPWATCFRAKAKSRCRLSPWTR